MIIAVNTQLLLPGRLDGIGWFTYETLKRITRNHPEHTFYFIFDRTPDIGLSFPSNVIFKVLSPPSRHPFLWFLRFEILLPFLLKKIKADIFLSPDGWMTLGTKIPCINVIHDLNFHHCPGDVPFWIRLYYNSLFPRYARKARRVATVSQYSKQDIAKTYRIDPGKIDVMHNGCNLAYSPQSEETCRKVREKYSDGNPFFLYVGALIPRKNIANMLRAFDRFKETDSTNTKLIIIGQKKWWTNQINEAYETMQFKDDVMFHGRKGVDELNILYAASTGLLLVSVFEGFGIPILEAFHSETAVITSNVSSMPEVAGDAALLVDPTSVGEIADAMTRLSTDVSLRNRLIEKGKVRRELFSWDQTANRLWDCIEMVKTEIQAGK